MARILIIEDCEPLLTTLASVLQRAGHEVVATACSKQGLAILQAGQVDLVITDIYMPPPDGLEILQFAGRTRLPVPIIAISGFAQPLNMFAEARLLGAAFTLQKPLTAQQLIETVEAALERASAAPFRLSPAAGSVPSHN